MFQSASRSLMAIVLSGIFIAGAESNSYGQESTIDQNPWFSLVAQSIAEGDMPAKNRALLIERALWLAQHSPISSQAPTLTDRQSILIRNPTLAPQIESVWKLSNADDIDEKVNELENQLESLIREMDDRKNNVLTVSANPFLLPSYTYEHRDHYGDLATVPVESQKTQALAWPESLEEVPSSIGDLHNRWNNLRKPSTQRIAELPLPLVELPPAPLLPVDDNRINKARR